ncbi:peroxisomal and mitochondrial division factor 1-like [Vigna radiata var. radiata]|uniref:Peroxisomal and mitochondrial division factor 1-like n=1 Tax=Vigna radiata var. radiata TaxID=3916 RepID=A0A1S3UA85_VIGRR|nr:peroxisomal and mitochondrial division factor 1-like [Vigna radiata var. radiata]
MNSPRAIFLCFAESVLADDDVANGGVDDQYSEESATKIEVLQRERNELVNENATRKEEIKKLTAELDILRRDGATNSEKIEELQREVAQSREVVKAVEITARAADLDTHVGDLMSEMAAAEEARVDLVESLEKELTSLKKDEVRIRDLERKIGVLETEEIEKRNKRIRFEEEMRDKVDEKEEEINGFKQKLLKFDTRCIKL